MCGSQKGRTRALLCKVDYCRFIPTGRRGIIAPGITGSLLYHILNYTFTDLFLRMELLLYKSIIK